VEEVKLQITLGHVKTRGSAVTCQVIFFQEKKMDISLGKVSALFFFFNLLRFFSTCDVFTNIVIEKILEPFDAKSQALDLFNSSWSSFYSSVEVRYLLC